MPNTVSGTPHQAYNKTLQFLAMTSLNGAPPVSEMEEVISKCMTSQFCLVEHKVWYSETSVQSPLYRKSMCACINQGRRKLPRGGAADRSER